MATHSSVLAWRIPGTGEPGGLPPMGSHRVGHDWSNFAAAAQGQFLLSIPHQDFSSSPRLVLITQTSTSVTQTQNFIHYSLFLCSYTVGLVNPGTFSSAASLWAFPLPLHHSSSSAIHTLAQAPDKLPWLKNSKNPLTDLFYSRLFLFIHFPYDSGIIFQKRSYRDLKRKRNE